MPKKTRKQKVISAYRRKLKLLEQLNQVPVNSPLRQTEEKTPSITVTKEKTLEVSAEKKVEKIPLDKKDSVLKDFFKQDLRKSLILIVLIIALEIIIYFGTINNYLRL